MQVGLGRDVDEIHGPPASSFSLCSGLAAEWAGLCFNTLFLKHSVSLCCLGQAGSSYVCVLEDSNGSACSPVCGGVRGRKTILLFSFAGYHAPPTPLWSSPCSFSRFLPIIIFCLHPIDEERRKEMSMEMEAMG